MKSIKYKERLLRHPLVCNFNTNLYIYKRKKKHKTANTSFKSVRSFN